MSEKPRAFVVKHLHDRDDLQKEGRDAGLIPGQENLAAEMATKLYEYATKKGYKALIFCVSTKKRTSETAEMVRDSLRNRSSNLHVLIEEDAELREMDQGTFVLPEDYKAGDSFDGLTLAWKALSAETFNADDPSKDNLDYHFGDPLCQADGTFKYPELDAYFSGYGESYRDILLRLYSCVIKLSDNKKRYGDRMLPVIFTHGQPYQVFRDLAEVADMIKNQGYKLTPGELPRVCQSAYKARAAREGTIPPGKVDAVPIEYADDPEIISILKQEISLLEKMHQNN
jgi:broad specificity phosphatase PhoE